MMDRPSKTQQSMGSFQTLQQHSKALLAQSTTIQDQIKSNREQRVTAQREMCKQYGRMTYANSDSARLHSDSVKFKVQEISQQISDLDNLHVVLIQRFIEVQSQIRQVIKEQGRRLSETLAQTRARASQTGRNTLFVSSANDVRYSDIRPQRTVSNAIDREWKQQA